MIVEPFLKNSIKMYNYLRIGMDFRIRHDGDDGWPWPTWPDTPRG